MNVQAIYLPNGMFSDIFARFPCSVYALRILILSQVRIYLENSLFIGQDVLGDSGYMLKKCLLTPYRQSVLIAK